MGFYLGHTRGVIPSGRYAEETETDERVGQGR